jgi:hypothetical protein
MVLACMNASAANISGQKWNDLDRDSNFSVTEPLLEGWNITLWFATNNTFTGIFNITDENGQYLLDGIDNAYTYYVMEDLANHPGWYNSSKRPTRQYVDFISDAGCPDENVFTGCANCLNNRIPPPRVFFGVESRFGDNKAGATSGGSGNELEVMYPIGQVYNLGNTKTYQERHLVWGNGTVYDFNLTYIPDGTVIYRVYNTSLGFSYTVSGNFFGTNGLQQPDNRVYGTNYPFNDIVIRTLSDKESSSVTIYDIVLTGPTGTSYTITNSPVFAAYSQGQIQQNVFIRANNIMQALGGGDVNQGFTLTGKQMFTFKSDKPGNLPQAFDLLYDIYVGNQICRTVDHTNRNFGNYELVGIIRGVKWDDVNGDGVKDEGEEGLPNWTINVFNATYLDSVLTDPFTGEYEIWVPYGSYSVNETQNASWIQTYPAGNAHSLTIDDTNWYTIYDIDFGNQIIPTGNISGYKFQDVYGNGTFLVSLANWTISLVNSTSGSILNTTTTAGNGFFNFTQVPNGTYYLNETLQYGWRNTSPASYLVSITTDGEEIVRNFTNEQYLANITGIKFNDGNHDGIFEEDIEPLIEGWNISVYFKNSTYIRSQFTDSDGVYNFGGLDKEEEYIVQEDVPPGWVNTTPDSVSVDFTNLTICPGIFHIDNDALLLARMPNARLVFVPESRIGSDATYEMDIHYIDPVFTVPVTAEKNWVNGTDYNFNVTYDSVTENVTYTVDGTTISMPAHHPLTAPFLFSDFAIRTRATRAGSQIDVFNLSLTVQGTDIPIDQTAYGETNTSTAFGPTPPSDLDILWIRANYLAQQVNPSLDIMNGFTLTGTQRMTWDTANKPTASQLAYTIKVGQPTCPLDTNRFVVFGNYQFNNVSGYKNQDPIGDGTNGTPLSGWNISLWDENGIKMDEIITDAQGFYSFQNLTFGNYTINETLQNGWSLTFPQSGYHSAFINATYLEYSNLNFTNQRSLCMGGYKLDPEGNPQPGWTITIDDEVGTVGTNVTNSSGYWQVCGLWPDTYNVSETMQDGWAPQDPATGYQNVTLTDASNFTVNFTNQWDLCVGGYKLDGIGTPLSGWTITVAGDKGDIASNITDDNGYWQVCGLWPDTYNVSETMQDGWAPQDPATGYQDVTLTDASNFTVNFTNQRSLCLSGYKVDQNNGPQPNWEIVVRNSTGSIVGTNITNSSGYWSVCDLIQDTYNVSETMQLGWVAVDPASGYQEVPLSTADVGGVNFTNQRSLCLSGYKVDQNNGPQPNWEIVVRNSTGSIVGTNITNSSGYWSVCDLIQDTYNVSETMQLGWVAVDPASGYQEVPLSTADVGGVNFTNQRSLCLSGYKVDQNNGPQPNWEIVVRNSTGSIVGTNITNSSGYWSVCDLIQDTYNVSETMQLGWVAVDPASGYQEVPLSTADVGGVNFTNQRSLCLSGYKVDQNNGPQPNWEIVVRNSTGSIVGTNITNSSGYWSVCDLIQDTYNVSETMQLGWVAVDPASGYQEVPLSTADVGGVNFTNGRLGSITGIKFSDLNGNGLREFNDPALSGWSIQLFFESNNTLFKSTTTNASGMFDFSSIPQGSYLLKEVLQSGWKQTAPSGGTYSIIINKDSYLFTGKNFGNQKIVVNPCSCPTQAIFAYSVLKTPLHTIQFTDKSTGYPVSWLWKFGDGKISTSRNPKHTYARKGAYTVTLAVMSYDCAGKSRWSYYTKKISVP